MKTGQNDFIKDNLDLIILQSLLVGDKPFSDIVENVAERLGKKSKIRDSAISNGIKTLESNGYIYSYFDADSTNTVKIYKISESGKMQLADNGKTLSLIKQILDMLATQKPVDSDNVFLDINNIDNINNNIVLTGKTKNQSLIDKDEILKEIKKYENSESIIPDTKADLDLTILDGPKYKQEEINFNIDNSVYSSKKDYKTVFSDIIQQNMITTADKTAEIEEIQQQLNEDVKNNAAITYSDDLVKEDYTSLKNDLILEGVKMKPYDQDLKSLKMGLLLKNKLLLFTSIAFSILMLLDILIFFLAFKNTSNMSLLGYIIFAIVSLIPITFGLILYLRNRTFKTKDRFNFNKYFVFSLLIFGWLIVLNIILSILCKINIGSLEQLLKFIILPTMFYANAPIIVVVHLFLRKLNFFYY